MPANDSTSFAAIVAVLALAFASSIPSACTSSSGASTFGGMEDAAGGSGGSASSGGISFGANVPLCPGCSADGGASNQNCPSGWMSIGCNCYLANHLCVDPKADCSGVPSACLPETLANGNGDRCHCSCPVAFCSMGGTASSSSGGIGFTTSSSGSSTGSTSGGYSDAFTCTGCIDLNGACNDGGADNKCGMTGGTCVDCTNFHQVCSPMGACM
jgi:hypothetical protein